MLLLSNRLPLILKEENNTKVSEIYYLFCGAIVLLRHLIVLPLYSTLQLVKHFDLHFLFWPQLDGREHYHTHFLREGTVAYEV